MSTKMKEPSEDDVIIARALSSYAQLRANVASWSGLPAAPIPSGEPDDEDEELFTAESETAGVGYVVPQDGERIKISTEKLRKQMLGKRTRDGHAGLERFGGPKRMAGPRKGVSGAVAQDGDSEEEEGRSAVGKKRKHRAESASKLEAREDLDEMKGADTGSSVARKAPNSYLDELLAKRKKKKKKKQAKDPE